MVEINGNDGDIDPRDIAKCLTGLHTKGHSLRTGDTVRINFKPPDLKYWPDLRMYGLPLGQPKPSRRERIARWFYKLVSGERFTWDD